VLGTKKISFKKDILRCRMDYRLKRYIKVQDGLQVE